MSYDYGTLYGMNRIDPMNSRAYLSWMPTGTDAIYISEAPVPNDDFGGYPLMYIEDNDSLREFVYRYGNTIKIYNVNLGNGTGTSSISLTAQLNTTAHSAESGIKRINDDLYYLYRRVITTPGDEIIDFKRESISSGGNVTESLLIVTIPRSSNDDFNYSTFANGRKIYYCIVHQQTIRVGEPGKWRNEDIFVYCLDIESDMVSLIFSVTLPTLSGDEFYKVAQPWVVEILGDIKLYVTYAQITQQVGMDIERYIHKMSIDGITTDIFDFSPVIGGVIPMGETMYRYNYRDAKIFGNFIHQTIHYYFVIDTISGLFTSTTDITPDTPPIKFSSAAVFPKIGYETSVYYWLDSEGKRTSAITLTGVNTIYYIFPTLDTINGSMYVSALMNDSTKKLLSVNAFTGEILAQFILPNFPYGSISGLTFNHGNFFMKRSGLSMQIAYLADVPPIFGVGENQMLEMN